MRRIFTFMLHAAFAVFSFCILSSRRSSRCRSRSISIRLHEIRDFNHHKVTRCDSNDQLLFISHTDIRYEMRSTWWNVFYCYLLIGNYVRRWCILKRSVIVSKRNVIKKYRQVVSQRWLKREIKREREREKRHMCVIRDVDQIRERYHYYPLLVISMKDSSR